MLLGLVSQDSNVAMLLHLELVDRESSHEAGRQRREFREHLRLRAHRALLVDEQHALVQVALPHVCVAGRNGVEHFLHSLAQLDFRCRLCGCLRDAKSREEQRDETEQARTTMTTSHVPAIITTP